MAAGLAAIGLETARARAFVDLGLPCATTSGAAAALEDVTPGLAFQGRRGRVLRDMFNTDGLLLLVKHVTPADGACWASPST